VRISSAFYLGRTEVTRGEWKTVMNTEPWKNFIRNDAWEGPEFPAVNVSWEDSLDFCNKLTEIERAAGGITNNQEYRLPTEAEWEYACRAGSQTSYCFGDDLTQLGQYCWWGGGFRNGSGSAVGEKFPHKVGQKRPNRWGVFDMHGNAAEWCRDAFDERAYENRKGISIDPIHEIGDRHVYRGGQWAGNSWMSRSAYRYGITEKDAKRPNTVHGLRVVRSQ
jgi:formylglycine-generating enzyme required for sulfatase activity